MSIYVVDIDGTIADLTHRIDYVRSKPKNWPAFERGIKNDKPIQPVIDMVNDLHKEHVIVYCSGRGNQSREATMRWMLENGVAYDKLYMRAERDYRRDDIIKHELHEQIWAEYGVKPVLYIDDRDQVVDMIRARGDICLQVQPGDF